MVDKHKKIRVVGSTHKEYFVYLLFIFSNLGRYFQDGVAIEI